jgi:NAD(P)-dependent dehydrogenase (short-subunit alcohol dehydrogenase family)
VTPPQPVPSASTAPPLPAHKLLSGLKALVTGANSGIGRGVAVGLAQAGADVMVNYVAGDDAAAAVVDEIRRSGAHGSAYTWLPSALNARLAAITAFRLTTTVPERLARFYESIGLSVGQAVLVPPAEMRLLGLAGGGIRIALNVGEQRIDLEAFDRRGRAYPENATAADLCFQHFALVTPDAAAAWERARAHGATPISIGGPVTLTASAGGLTAVKFRDPEGHPLELVQFPTAPEDRRRSE